MYDDEYADSGPNIMKLEITLDIAWRFLSCWCFWLYMPQTLPWLHGKSQRCCLRTSDADRGTLTEEYED